MIIKDWALLWKYSWSYIQAVIMDQPKLDYHLKRKLSCIRLLLQKIYMRKPIRMQVALYIDSKNLNLKKSIQIYY